MTKARSCDWLNRLMGITSVPSGANQLPLSFDKYTNRTVPGYVDVLGIGTSTAAVTVNGTGAYRRGEYFHVALPVDNSSGPQYPSIVIQAVAGANSASSTGSVFLAKTPETFVHDADGNLTQDGRWIYTWDGENRLVTMEALSAVPAAAKLRVEFEYDWRGRRIGKAVKAWSETSYTNVYVLKFLYDGWNPVAELDANNAVVRSYLWGTDISGSFQGAGGVGGLLAVNVATNGVHFPAYDGNGNIAGLVSASSGAITARYEYGPFGEVIRATGPMARVNPFRWSTRYQDDESDLVMYPRRPFNLSTGRFLCKDPIQEQGGLNLYAFAQNDAVDLIDPLGLDTITATDDIVVKSDYPAHKVLGPPKCPCSKSVIGTVQVRYAYAKATTGESLSENHQDIINAFNAALSIPTYNQARAQAASFLGAGFIMDFTPNGNAANCCKNIYWKQWIIYGYWRFGRTAWRGLDYTAGYTAADFPGDIVNAIGRNRTFGKIFLLELYCDKEVIWTVWWSYNVNYTSGSPDHATVTLDGMY